MTNNTNTHQTNPCFIGVDVLPRLKRKEEHLRKQKQARRLYWIQNLYTLMFCVFTVFTIIGVMGGVQTASLGLHSLAVTFLFVGIGATFLMFGALYSIRQVARKRLDLWSEGYDYGED